MSDEKKFEFTVPADATDEKINQSADEVLHKKVDDDIDDMFKDFPSGG